MEILTQCQKWNEEGAYQNIVDALEGIEAAERTPEIDSELARAYNNLADPCEPSGREMFKKAVELLLPHAEYFAGDHYWNFRLGYSYFYLNQEGRALPYFQQALESLPGDEDTQEMIDECMRYRDYVAPEKCFRARVKTFWEVFCEREKDFRQMIDDDAHISQAEACVKEVESTLHIVFEEIAFEMGYNGEKYELILTPEGNVFKLLELVYLQRYAPAAVWEHWNILVGRQPLSNISIRMDDGCDVTGEEVQVWLEEENENMFNLYVYCEKLLPMLEQEEGRAWWVLHTLTSQELGEITFMKYIDGFTVVADPKSEPSIPLTELSDKLKERVHEFSMDPMTYFADYYGYEREPNLDTDSGWREDVLIGISNCPWLEANYQKGDNTITDDLHADGAIAGYFVYPLDTLRDEENNQKIFNFRDRLEEALLTEDGKELLTITGYATGVYCAYIDCIVWDVAALLEKAKTIFAETEVLWACFRTFRKETSMWGIKVPPEEN